jgi:hypothetical protein
MAGIDKIYGTRDEAIELHRWIKRHRPKEMRRLYPIDGYEDCLEQPLSNFSTSTDNWLARKCPLPFVLRRLGEQYGSSKTGRIAKERLAERM